MNLGISKMAVIGIALALALTGCHKISTDMEPVIAKIGVEKVTEKSFHEFINAFVGDPENSRELLNSERLKGQRNEILADYLTAKGLMMMAKQEGLDSDPEVQAHIDDAFAQVYARAIFENRMPSEEPTEAQLREIYNEIAAFYRASGVAVPPFSEAKPDLPQLWMRKQQQEVAEALMKEIKEKFPDVEEEQLDAKILAKLAKEEGLDEDPGIKLQLEGAVTQVYFQTIVGRRLSNAEPTEAQLLEVYNELAAMRSISGLDTPPFADVRPQLPQAWMQKQQQTLADALMKEIKEKYPAIIADEYKTADS
jgi:hypothetical protein